MVRLPTIDTVTLGMLCGGLFVSLFLLHAKTVLGENVIIFLLTAKDDTVLTTWALFYEIGGVCLLGALPVLLYTRYGVITPAVVLGVLSVGYLYLADAQVPYLFMIWTPQFVSVALGVGTAEYLLKLGLLETTSLPSGLETALALGVLHAIVITGALGELSVEFVLLSLGTVYVVAVPTLLFLQFGAVGPSVGVVVGLVFVFAAHEDSLPAELPFLIPRALVPIFLFGGIEYALRSTNVAVG